MAAAHTGTAPITAWSGRNVRQRLDRRSNHQAKVALPPDRVTQIRCPGSGEAYVAERRAADDTRTEAIRALRRRLSDEVFRRLQADEAAQASVEGVTRAACLTQELIVEVLRGEST